jgi:carboxyl-terminal processing protease
MLRRLILLFLLMWPTAWAEDFGQRFDAAWRLVAERYWDLDFVGVDWQEVRERYEVKLEDIASDAELFALLEAMYEELGDDHSIFVPPARVAEIRERYGDLPCLGVFSAVEELLEGGNVHYRLLEGGIGYLRLPDLVVTGSARDLRAAVRALTMERAVGLILDLRGNPGGRLVEMMQAAGVFTQGFLWRVVTRWTLPMPYPALGGAETDLPLVVLVDGGVNSAAEGLAGALKKSGRATLIGEATAGNVEAVLPFCLRDGSQAWIATGVLAPLTGATWEGRGVEPDIESPADEALEAAIAFLVNEEER